MANDQGGSEPVQQSLMDMVISPGVKTSYFTLQKTIDVIHCAESANFYRLQTPLDVLTLVFVNVPIAW